MVTAPLGQSSLQHFNSRLQGELIGMSDAGYDHARSVWNGRIDKYPALIVRCADLTDILAAVQFARVCLSASITEMQQDKKSFCLDDQIVAANKRGRHRKMKGA